ncbi:MAG: hypothetical protein V3W34_16455 [Phycisphaerae bacterium]
MSTLSLVLTFSVIGMAPLAYAGTVLYVDASASGTPNNGSSWCNAYLTLQDALAVAVFGDTIRVADGTYKPDQGTGQTAGDRAASFELVSRVALEGGYAGCGAADPDERDFVANETILSGDLSSNDTPDFANHDENSYQVVSSIRTTATTVLDGFTITGGANTVDSFSRGGGIYAELAGGTVSNCVLALNIATQGGGLNAETSSLTLAACTFRDNSALGWWGGGARIVDGTVALNDCTFDDNSSTSNGGGLAVWDSGDGQGPSTAVVTLNNCGFFDNESSFYGGGIYNRNVNLSATDCVFERNKARWGGGIKSYGGPGIILRGCTFDANSSDDDGGGIHSGFGLDSTDSFVDCVFIANTSGDNGGAFHKIGVSETNFVNCVFVGNHADDRGGATFFGQNTGPVIVNSVFSGNTSLSHGGAMYLFGIANPLIVNCTFSNNSSNLDGGAIYNTVISSPIMINTVLWGNTDQGGSDESAQFHLDDGFPVIHHSVMQGWTGTLGGTGNSGADPLFADPDGADDFIGTLDDDPRPLPGSSVIDAGINIALIHDQFDLDADADTVELVPVDLDGRVRFIDVFDVPDAGSGESPRVDIGAYEHTSDCNGNEIPDDIDISAGTSLDCDRDGVPDECQPSVDCNNNGVCDDLDISNGTSFDCNGNGIPDECGEDCNGNLLADSCDIDSEFSDDCNEDGIPDECLTRELDCNDNGSVDECETAGGASPDTNGNGVPDECEPSVLFVDAGATGINNGTSWADAFTDLQDALDVARGSVGYVDNIWVAKGSYAPDRGTGDRAARFQLVSGVGLYGGFAGGETLLSERDPIANETVLTGDLNANDIGDFGAVNRLDNSYNVVLGDQVNDQTVVDGFTIRGGHAVPPTTVDRNRGAGMWVDGDPLLENLVFERNWAFGNGGGLYSTGSPRLRKCLFTENASENWGGGMFTEDLGVPFPNIVTPTLIDCAFVANEADRGGGLAMTGQGTQPWLSNCKFVGNAVTGGGRRCLQ